MPLLEVGSFVQAETFGECRGLPLDGGKQPAGMAQAPGHPQVERFHEVRFLVGQDPADAKRARVLSPQRKPLVLQARAGTDDKSGQQLSAPLPVARQDQLADRVTASLGAVEPLGPALPLRRGEDVVDMHGVHFG